MASTVDTAAPRRGFWAWWRRRFARPVEPEAVTAPAVDAPGFSPAALASLPTPSTIEAPWEGALALSSASPDEARKAALAHLWGVLDGVKTEADRAFLLKLSRECGASRVDFPLFPDAALQLDAVLRGRDPSLEEVARIVRREPDLARRVWQEANGAFFQRKAATLDEAIVRVGFDALWRIGMRACMNAPVFRVRGFEREVNHARAVSIVTADVAEFVAPGGDVFMAGLLHAIGKLVVYRAASVRPPAAEPDAALVRDVARALHPTLGVLVADAWKLPPAVVAAIAHASYPERATGDDHEAARAVRAGCIAAHTAAEARAGRDIGGLRALLALPGPPLDAARLVARADEAWSGPEIDRVAADDDPAADRRL